MSERRIRRYALKHEAAPKELDESTTVMAALGWIVLLGILAGMILQSMGGSK